MRMTEEERETRGSMWVVTYVVGTLALIALGGVLRLVFA